MISAWHLLWIVPLSASIGLVTAALCVASGRGEPQPYCRYNKIDCFYDCDGE